MNDNTLFAVGMAAAAVVILGFSSCTFAVNQTDNNAMVRMVVERGADPVAALCAVKGSQLACAAASANRK